MKPKPFFVDYFVSFGQIAHEEFSSWQEMEFFKRQLRPNAVLSFGEIQPSLAAEKRAA